MRRLTCPSCGEQIHESPTALSHEELFALAPDRFTQHELYDRARQDHDISKSTVRKRIHDMRDRGWIDEIARTWPKQYRKHER